MYTKIQNQNQGVRQIARREFLNMSGGGVLGPLYFQHNFFQSLKIEPS